MLPCVPRGRCGVNLGAMKRFVLIALLLTAWVMPAAANDWSWAGLVERNGVFFKKFSDVPFEGRLKPPNSGVFRRGLPEGKFVLYGDSPHKVAEHSFLNGRKHGESILYFNVAGRRAWTKWTYKNGTLHGPYVSYDFDGQLNAKGRHKNGRREGPWEFKKDGYGTSLNEYGKMQSGIYRNDKRIACLPITPQELCVISR